MLNYAEKLKIVEGFKVDWGDRMETTTLENVFNKLSTLQGYRSSVTEYMSEAYQERIELQEKFKSDEINYENHIKYLVTTDIVIKEARSDKAKEALADMKPDSLLKKKTLFESEKCLARCEAYIKVLHGYLSNLDKQVDIVQQQIYLMNLDLKINPSKINLL